MTLLLFRQNTLKVKYLRMTEKRHFSFLLKTWQKLCTVAELTLLMFFKTDFVITYFLERTHALINMIGNCQIYQ